LLPASAFAFRFQLSALLPSLLPLSVLLLPQKFNCFHIPASCFMKNASASSSSKSQMLPSMLPLPASSKCFRFHKNLIVSASRFHIPGLNKKLFYLSNETLLL